METVAQETGINTSKKPVPPWGVYPTVLTYLQLGYPHAVSGLMIATLTAYDQANSIVYEGTREYPDNLLLWEHIGCQQNNQRTVRVRVETEDGLEYEIRFSAWTPARQFSPSRRFHDLLRVWGAQFS